MRSDPRTGDTHVRDTGDLSGVITFTGVKAYRAQGDAIVAIVDGAIDDTSNEFSVTPAGTLAGLTIDSIGSQTAGTSFPLQVTVYDPYGNLATSYTGSPAISGLAVSPGCGTCSPPISASGPSYGTFLGTGWSTGTQSVDVTARKSVASTLTVADGSVSNTSNSFAVAPGPLGDFTLSAPPATAKTAGSPSM